MFPPIRRRFHSPRRRSSMAVPRGCRPALEALERRELLSGTGTMTGQLQAAYGQIPLSFEANQGQTDAQVRYVAHGAGYALFLTPTEAVLALQRSGAAAAGPLAPPSARTEAVLRMRLVGANAAPAMVGLDRQEGISNYFLGKDPRQWHAGITNFGRVEYAQVYPGIDLVYHGNQRQLEYDFQLSPGADPSGIRLSFQGAESVTLDAQGELVLHTAGGDVVEHAPVLYQETAWGRKTVTGSYVLEGPSTVCFRVGVYDGSLPLVIDPVLSYSSYLGGSGGDDGNGIAVDAAGNAYLTGETLSADFPTTAGAFQATKKGTANAFVTKLNASGTGLVYSTYLGGSNDVANEGDTAARIAVDAAGDAYVTGTTYSTDFPTTAGAFQAAKKGSSSNAFVTKLNANGTALAYSTYLGGDSSGAFGDSGADIAVDAAGDAYVTGTARSADFPTTAGAFQTTKAGPVNVFVTKLSADGSTLVYSSYLGGSGFTYLGFNYGDSGGGIAVDAAGNAYLTGSTYSSDFPTTAGAFQAAKKGVSDNAFVTKVNPSGSALVYSTYLGGTNGSIYGGDGGSGIAVNAAGNAYVTGSTTSLDFPTAHAFQPTKGGGSVDHNAFVTELSADGTKLVYSSYLGGSYNDVGYGIALDAAGNVYLTGTANSTDFPTVNAFQPKKGGSLGTPNAFVTKVNASGTALVYSTYLGGSGFGDSGRGIAVDAAGDAYVTGTTSSTDFPTTAGAFQTTNHSLQTNAFVTKFLGPQRGRLFAVGGAPGRVRVYDTDNTDAADFAPFGAAYTGPVSVAVGDVTGVGVYDLVVAAAAGNPDVRVYDGQAFANGTFDPNNPNASLLTEWLAYGLNFDIGANVAVGDIEHDGFADIVTGATAGNPDVRVYRGKDIAQGTFNPTGASLLAQWFPYGLNFNIGANVAVGDVTGDGFADVVTGATAGNPDVRVYNGKDIAQGTFNPTGSSLLAQWFPYALNFNVGAFVAVGDTTGDGFGDVITGATAGNPDVRVYSGKDIAHGTFDPAGASQLDQFFAYALGTNTGATVAAADFEGTGKDDLLTGATTAPHYRLVKGNATGIQPPALFEGMPNDLQGGIAVGA